MDLSPEPLDGQEGRSDMSTTTSSSGGCAHLVGGGARAKRVSTIREMNLHAY
jgi:hypothetical protein